MQNLSRKKKGSRLTAFLEEEKDFLMPLPASLYETAVWSTATIQPDYLITVGNCKYSVPYEFIGKKVDIRATEKSIEVLIVLRRMYAGHTHRILYIYRNICRKTIENILAITHRTFLNGEKQLVSPRGLW